MSGQSFTAGLRNVGHAADLAEAVQHELRQRNLLPANYDVPVSALGSLELANLEAIGLALYNHFGPLYSIDGQR